MVSVKFKNYKLFHTIHLLLRIHGILTTQLTQQQRGISYIQELQTIPYNPLRLRIHGTLTTQLTQQQHGISYIQELQTIPHNPLLLHTWYTNYSTDTTTAWYQLHSRTTNYPTESSTSSYPWYTNYPTDTTTAWYQLHSRTTNYPTQSSTSSYPWYTNYPTSTSTNGNFFWTSTSSLYPTWSLSSSTTVVEPFTTLNIPLAKMFTWKKLYLSRIISFSLFVA